MASKRSSEKDVAVSASAGLAPARRKASTQPRARRAVATPETPAPEATVILSSTAVTISFEPTHEDIASLAYTYWQARGCQGGSPEEDWTRAEQELRARAAASVVA